MADNVQREQDARTPMGGIVNGDSNYSDLTPAAKLALETNLTNGGYVARVVFATANYVKVKWFLNNKLFAVYKSKTFTTIKAQQFLQTMIDISAGTIEPTSVTVSPKTASGAAASTVQITATVSPAQANQGVTWTTSDATKATVSSTGLVTRVATGSATITATTKSGPVVTDTAVITIT